MTTAGAHTVAIVSPLGGTGCTTLAAHLATLVAVHGRACLAVDLCAQNLLGRHLGLQQPAEAGWAGLAAQQQWWGQAALRNSQGVDLLPFGAASAEVLDTLQRACLHKPEWLRQQLDALDVPPGSVLVLDAPTWPAPLARQALAAADTVVVVLDASARACQAQALVSHTLAGAPAGAHCAIAINRTDPRRPSQRSALQALRAQWADLLLPYTVHEDENLAQACEHATSVCAWAPHAQSSHDLQGIGQWLAERLPAMPAAGLPAPVPSPLPPPPQPLPEAVPAPAPLEQQP